MTFVIAAFLGALSGWLYAHLGRFVSPGPFDASMGIEYLMMAMVGGAGSILGGVVGAAIVTLLKNSVQDYLPLIAKGASGQLEIVAFSALFILFLQRARQGIVPFLVRLSAGAQAVPSASGDRVAAPRAAGARHASS